MKENENVAESKKESIVWKIFGPMFFVANTFFGTILTIISYIFIALPLVVLFDDMGSFLKVILLIILIGIAKYIPFANIVISAIFMTACLISTLNGFQDGFSSFYYVFFGIWCIINNKIK